MNFSNVLPGVSSSDRRRRRPSRTSPQARRVGVEPLERRELLAATAFISEVHPAGSGNGTYAADWFEVTNPGPTALDVTGWRMDDNSNLFSSSAPLRAPTTTLPAGSIPAGKSVVFVENSTAGVTDESVIAAFSNAWFGTPVLPPGVLVGAYGGAGVGMGAGGDAVNLFNASGTRITGISFGTASPAATFDNVAGLGSATLPLPVVTTPSAAGVNGGFLAADGKETGSPGRTITGVDLSTYVRVGRYDLPEPTRTAAPPGSLLAKEASAVTYNWDTDTLFIVGDLNTSIVQVSKTGQLIDSMTLGVGEFDDTEALTYVGGGKFVLGEERERQVNLITYAPGTTLTRSSVQTVDLGTSTNNAGLEGISYDPAKGGFIVVNEAQPRGIFQTGIDFPAGTATNGSATTESSVNLFDPTLAGLLDFADVFALSNLPTLNGYADSGNLLVLSQESGRIVNIDRSGNISSSLTIVSDPGNPLDVPGQQHEGLTMDAHSFLYVVNENGGGDVDHPQLWVYAPATVPNQAPTALALANQINAIAENSSTVSRVKVADVVVTDDGIGTNTLTVIGPDAAFFEVDSNGLYIKAGTTLDHEAKTSYSVTVVLDDTTAGATPDATAAFTLTVIDLVSEDPVHPSLVISEVAPWSSGSPVGADWFEVTNTGATPVSITGWKVDDSSASPGAALALVGISSIAPGESVIFMETSDLPAKTALFLSTWFGANPPAGLQIGSYSGGSVGLSTGGDAVNLFDGGGILQAGVTFGASPTAPLASFNNALGLNNTVISQLSVAGVNGAFVAANDANEIGSPGTVGRLFISEVAPWGSGRAPVSADWFEVTNTTAHAVDITGWKVDDSSASFGAALALNGITTIAPGESVIFIETNDLAAKSALFLSTWFGPTPPANLQIGSYSGGSVGLSTTADGVNLYNGAGVLQASVTFGASPAGPSFSSFDNAAALNNATISQLSGAGVNGAFVAVNDAGETGSPGTINNVPPVPGSDAVATAEDTAVTFNVLTNDTDADGDAPTITGYTSVSHGALISHGDGSFTYTPTPNFNGSDSFTYTITDGKGRTATATVSITVDAVNDAPVLTVPAGQTTAEDVAVTITGITVADIDIDEGAGVLKLTLSVSSGTLTIGDTIASGLTSGQITGNGTSVVILEGSIEALNATLAAGVRYLGSLNFNGGDALTIVANDLGATGAGGAAADSKTVPIRVLSPAEQIDGLAAMVATLHAQAVLGGNHANALLKKLVHARTALAEGKPRVACAAIRGFVDNVGSLVEDGVLTPTEARPLLSAADTLLIGIRTGSGI